MKPTWNKPNQAALFKDLERCQKWELKRPVWPDLAIFEKSWLQILYKVSLNVSQLLSLFEKWNFLGKHVCDFFLGNFWEIWANIYILPSGHTGIGISVVLTV